jgi:hypothetical protein
MIQLFNDTINTETASTVSKATKATKVKSEIKNKKNYQKTVVVQIRL